MLNEDLHSLHHSPNLIRMIKSSYNEEGRSVIKFLRGRPIGKRPLG